MKITSRGSKRLWCCPLRKIAEMSPKATAMPAEPACSPRKRCLHGPPWGSAGRRCPGRKGCSNGDAGHRDRRGCDAKRQAAAKLGGSSRMSRRTSADQLSALAELDDRAAMLGGVSLFRRQILPAGRFSSDSVRVQSGIWVSRTRMPALLSCTKRPSSWIGGLLTKSITRYISERTSFWI